MIVSTFNASVPTTALRAAAAASAADPKVVERCTAGIPNPSVAHNIKEAFSHGNLATG